MSIRSTFRKHHQNQSILTTTRFRRVTGLLGVTSFVFSAGVTSCSSDTRQGGATRSTKGAFTGNLPLDTFNTVKTLLGAIKAYNPDDPLRPGAITSGAGGYCLNPYTSDPATQQDPWRPSGDGTCGGNPARRAIHESICTSGAPSGTGLCGPCDYRAYPEAPACAKGESCTCETAAHEIGLRSTGYDCSGLEYVVETRPLGTIVSDPTPSNPNHRTCVANPGPFEVFEPVDRGPNKGQPWNTFRGPIQFYGYGEGWNPKHTIFEYEHWTWAGFTSATGNYFPYRGFNSGSEATVVGLKELQTGSPGTPLPLGTFFYSAARSTCYGTCWQNEQASWTACYSIQGRATPRSEWGTPNPSIEACPRRCDPKGAPLRSPSGQETAAEEVHSYARESAGPGAGRRQRHRHAGRVPHRRRSGHDRRVCVHG